VQPLMRIDAELPDVGRYRSAFNRRKVPIMGTLNLSAPFKRLWL
jgi:hypothetical protein